MSLFIKAKELGEHFCNVHQLDPNKDLPVEYIAPSSLVRPARLDLLSKITYAQEYIKGTLTEQAIFDYKEFIKGFSLNKFTEGDGSKSNFNDFRESFDSLICSIKNNGFDPIHAVPVGEDNTIIGGAHRTAIMVALRQQIPIVRLQGLVANYDADYFKQRDVAEEVIETSLTRLANYINASVFILWPSMTSKQKKIALELIQEKGHVIYQREDDFNFQGLHALVTMTYIGHPWIGSPQDRYAGAVNKTKEVYGKPSTLTTTLFIEMDSDEAIDLKIKIRDILSCGNNGVHCTDNSEETLYLLNILLNRNTRHLLIHGNPFYFKKYIESVMQYRQNIINNQLSIDDFSIVSSGVLGLYGLRLPNDIDFVSLSDGYNLVVNENTESHHHVLQHDLQVFELIKHPVNFIVFFDIKVISIQAFILMNKHRQEQTKINDIAQVQMLLNNEENTLIFYRLKLKWYQALRKFKLSRFGINNLLRFMKNSTYFSPLYNRLRKSRFVGFVNRKLSSAVNKLPKW
ncbi:hypothetical protein [Thiomicrospira microaerophila]|uniref:hypothetical protein n=1 Tax=Thiomicrospira microaerophila TaxID=406020 RepID=UPI0005C805AA|nr:hypothetical protein [Thiomicrospira microaerophila]